MYTTKGYRPIREIKEGENLYSREEGTGKIEPKKVERVIESKTNVIYTITIEGNTKITTTANHPFYVEGKGWVEVIDLIEEDKLVTYDGFTSIISMKKEECEEAVTVYNLQVEDWVTYFVSEGKVYVHNCGGKKEGSVLLNRYSEPGEGGGGTGNINVGDRTPKGKEFSRHAAEQANKRKYSPEEIDDIIENWTEKGYQPGGRTIYVKKQPYGYDVVVVDKNGKSIISVIGGNAKKGVPNTLQDMNAVKRMMKNQGGYYTMPMY